MRSEAPATIPCARGTISKPSNQIMQTANLLKTLCAGLLVIASITTASGQRMSRVNSPGQIPGQVMLRIVRAEDERLWNDGLTSILRNKDGRVRKRAALALGRIGDERALAALSEALRSDKDIDVRQMGAFAIGENESPADPRGRGGWAE